MNPKGGKRKRDAWTPPRMGQRMIKTAVAVFICLAFYCFRGYRGEDMPTEAAITAIICMQPYVRDSREYALNRMTGTLIGAGWGLLFLSLAVLLPVLSVNLYVLYLLMSVGVLLSLYTSVALRKPDASSLAAIVFICVVIAFPEIENPIRDAIDRVLGVMVGTAAAVGVNVFHLPRNRNKNLLFFVRTDDLAPDRFSPISPTVLFRLNSFCQDGAKICLVSRHAPAFLTSQLSAITLNLPMIVMDGAALYDASENRYLQTENIRETDSAVLMERLERMGLSYFLYTVHGAKTCIFHHGAYTARELDVLNRLRRSPYRSYLDEEVYEPGEIVCIKIIGAEADIDLLQKRLHTFLRGRRLRSSVQFQAVAPDISGLYIYSERATVRKAEHRIMQLLQKKYPDLTPQELFLPSGYHSEHDAMLLMHQLHNRYAPIRFLPFPFRKRDAKKK